MAALSCSESCSESHPQALPPVSPVRDLISSNPGKIKKALGNLSPEAILKDLESVKRPPWAEAFDDWVDVAMPSAIFTGQHSRVNILMKTGIVLPTNNKLIFSASLLYPKPDPFVPMSLPVTFLDPQTLSIKYGERDKAIEDVQTFYNELLSRKAQYKCAFIMCVSDYTLLHCFTNCSKRAMAHISCRLLLTHDSPVHSWSVIQDRAYHQAPGVTALNLPI